MPQIERENFSTRERAEEAAKIFLSLYPPLYYSSSATITEVPAKEAGKTVFILETVKHRL